MKTKHLWGHLRCFFVHSALSSVATMMEKAKRQSPFYCKSVNEHIQFTKKF